MDDSSPRILCVHQGWELYGSDRVFIQSLKAFRKRWPHCHLTVHLPRAGILAEEVKDIADELILGSMSVLRRGRFSFRSVSNTIKNISLNRKIAAGKDLVYINTGVILSYNILSIFFPGKYILHLHEIPDGLVRIYFLLLKSFSKAKIIANSHATAGASGTRHVVHNGVKDIVLQNKENCNGKLRLFLIGRINSWKGHKLAIDALKIFCSRGVENIELHFAGSYFEDQSQYLDNLKNIIVQHKLESYIHFHDFNHDPCEYYNQADIILVPSIKPEPFGLVAIEAMRAAIPVIAARHGGLPEIVINHETGKLFEPNSSQALADAIEYYLNNPELLGVYGTNGRERYLKYFQEEHYIDNFIREVELHVP